jgi:hypothetical protein
MAAPLTVFNNQTAASVIGAEQALQSWCIKYENKSDGTLFVPGSLFISHNGLTKLPDLSAVAVGGDFFCHNNKLTSLKGAPHTVGGDFWCYNNQLTLLEHALNEVQTPEERLRRIFFMGRGARVFTSASFGQASARIYSLTGENHKKPVF